MAHSCPECGDLCYCDLDDVDMQEPLEECVHECGPESDFDEEYGFDEQKSN
jgi:hypothetical protein